MEDIRSPLLKLQLASSYEPDMVISEVEDNFFCENEMADRITELHQLISPFGKNDAAIVLLETCNYIRFLHGQIEAHTTPYIEPGTPLEPQQQFYIWRGDRTTVSICRFRKEKKVGKKEKSEHEIIHKMKVTEIL
ncbi:hypothetical protein L1987_32062 [Smallanthus sonchifolius]|uniref:Uncharacterized protein n=1 Tax=Smallanthus sonchifolius TaxID=185202 RepID=A0ACB9I8K0_9ASTR|nr:hypothetical protein L1987_32062 [Smallanthus sonchifolius]